MKYKFWGLLGKGTGRNPVVILKVCQGQKGNCKGREMLITKPTYFSV